MCTGDGISIQDPFVSISISLYLSKIKTFVGVDIDILKELKLCILFHVQFLCFVAVNFHIFNSLQHTKKDEYEYDEIAYSMTIMSLFLFSFGLFFEFAFFVKN